MSEYKNQFKFHSIQFVLFPEFFNMPEPNKRSEFLAKFKERFSDAQETILPIPNDAPKDIPTMILNVQNNYSIRFAQSRIDFRFNSNSIEESSIEKIFSFKFKPLAKGLVETIENNFKDTIKIKRVGCIIRSYIEVEQPASKFKSIIKNDYKLFDFSEKSEFMIRNLRKGKLEIEGGKFNINEIVLIKNQELDHKNVWFVEFDINTNPEENYELDKWKLIEEFLDKEKEKNLESLSKIQDKIL